MFGDGYWTAGIDCGEQRHRVVVLDERGNRVHHEWVKNRVDEIQEMLWRLLSELPEGVKLAMVSEGCRSLGGVLAQVATPLGVESWQVNPKALNHYRDLEGQPRKDDDRDAELLAKMRLKDMEGCRLVVSSRPEERVLCRLTRLRSQLVGRRATALKRLRSRLLELCPEVLGSEWQGPDHKTKSLRAVLTRWPGFRGLEQARVSTVERVVRKSSRFGSKSAEIAKDLKETAARIMMDGDEWEVVALEMTTLIEEIEAVDGRVSELDKSIHDAVQRHPTGRKLMEMPGVGAWTAGVLIGEVLPLARHAEEGNAATYAGVTPLSRISSRSGKPSKLARGVNKHAARALYLSAVSSRSSSAIDDAYYRKQLERHLGHPVPHVKANISLARRRFVVMYKLMTTTERYDKEKLIASHLERLRQEKLRQARPAVA